MDWKFIRTTRTLSLLSKEQNIMGKTIILMGHVVNVTCICNTVYTQLIILHREHFLRRHVTGLIAPSSGRTSLRGILYCNAFRLSSG
jgi:hypothetical protein